MKALFLTAPLCFGLALALFFPFYGLSCAPYAFAALLILSFINFSTIDFKSFHLRQHFSARDLSAYFFSYIGLPSLQVIAAYFFLEDPSLRVGILLAALAPIAIVAPQFTEKSDKEKTIFWIITTTISFPILVIIFLKALNLANLGIQTWPLIKDLVLLTTLPLGMIFLFQKLTPSKPFISQKILQKLIGLMPYLNMCLIGFLVFIYFGSAFAKTNLSQIGVLASVYLLANALFQDFGTFLILKFLGHSKSIQRSFAMKNVALSGGTILIFLPQGILACSMIFIAHIIYFWFLFYQDQNHSKN